MPVLPLMLAWDGFVSVLRTYGVAELEAMTADLSSPDYRWEVGTITAMGNRWTYLIGTPARAGQPGTVESGAAGLTNAPTPGRGTGP